MAFCRPLGEGGQTGGERVREGEKRLELGYSQRRAVWVAAQIQLRFSQTQSMKFISRLRVKIFTFFSELAFKISSGNAAVSLARQRKQAVFNVLFYTIHLKGKQKLYNRSK